MAAPATVMKVEAEAEGCCVCGAGGELFTPEEHDASTGNQQHVPLRTMLLHLNHNKVVPEGRVCGSCAARAHDAYEFSTALGERAAPPLSDKIRALRRRLHELTQKIDVFIVVGGGGAAGGGAYSEDDIIMVEKDALAAAAAADAADHDHAKDARGDSVYQCSVCPLSFQRASELQTHTASHPADALHSCWTCGAQFESRAALAEHSETHGAPPAAACTLCGCACASPAELRRHEASCVAPCPACGVSLGSRSLLSEHVSAMHGRGSVPPLLCPACFLSFDNADLLSAHLLRHRQAKQFVCGYADCVLRFGTRTNLLAHIRKCHASELPEAPVESAATNEVSCDQCGRTFGSMSAMRRHARVHERQAKSEQLQESLAEMEGEVEGLETEEGEVEYLEVETLEDDADYVIETKPDLMELQ